MHQLFCTYFLVALWHFGLCCTLYERWSIEPWDERGVKWRRADVGALHTHFQTWVWVVKKQGVCTDVCYHITCLQYWYWQNSWHRLPSVYQPGRILSSVSLTDEVLYRDWSASISLTKDCHSLAQLMKCSIETGQQPQVWQISSFIGPTDKELERDWSASISLAMNCHVLAQLTKHLRETGQHLSGRYMQLGSD